MSHFHFISYCSCHHPDLHSFPTRRSSDLEADLAPLVDDEDAGRDVRLVERAVDQREGEVRDARLLEQALRSEEHTSELQSRRDLVCRLLLEKKKITI